MKATNGNRDHFRREADLCERLAEALVSGVLTTPGARRTIVLPELNVESVVPDFLAVALGRGPSLSGSFLSGVRTFDCAVLAELLPRGRRLEGLSAQLWSRDATVEESLGRLVKGGVVRKRSSGGFALSKDAFQDAHVIAIEAKLTRWTEAVAQARTYTSFADQAYVALPERVAVGREPLARECRRSGLGLIAVGRRDVCVLLRARTRAPKSRGWVWIVAKALAGLGESL